MIQTKRALIFALVFPIIALIALTAHKRYTLTSGSEIILPISGFDPINILSGHYLIYQIDYGVEGLCPSKSPKQVGYVCLEPKIFSDTLPQGCSKLIRGVCNYGRFEAGIEKYYVPEDKAKDLEEQVRLKKASIVLSVTSDGQAQVKDLLINNQSWKKE